MNLTKRGNAEEDAFSSLAAKPESFHQKLGALPGISKKNKEEANARKAASAWDDATLQEGMGSWMRMPNVFAGKDDSQSCLLARARARAALHPLPPPCILHLQNSCVVALAELMCAGQGRVVPRTNTLCIM